MLPGALVFGLTGLAWMLPGGVADFFFVAGLRVRVRSFSSLVRTGSPEVRCGSPEVRTGSPEVRTGSPEVRTGSPDPVRTGSETDFVRTGPSEPLSSGSLLVTALLEPLGLLPPPPLLLYTGLLPPPPEEDDDDEDEEYAGLLDPLGDLLLEPEWKLTWQPSVRPSAAVRVTRRAT